jgi:hypothetical protein
VVSEDCEDGHTDVAACVGDDLCLLGLACRREISREQDDVALCGDVLERTLDALARRFRRVQISRCGNAYHTTRCCTFWQNGNGGPRNA